MSYKKKGVYSWKRGKLGQRQTEIKEFKKRMQYPQRKVKPTKHLETERQNFPHIMYDLIDTLDIKEKCSEGRGRPSCSIKDIIKCLLLKIYSNLSYRRMLYDLEGLYGKGIINSIPKRSVLSKYMGEEQVKKILQDLICLSSKFFIDSEDTLLMDSTWLSKFMSTRNNGKEIKSTHNHFEKTRKVHVACLKNSKIIVGAIPTNGTAHDSPYFEPLLKNTMESGFNIKTVLADAGYSSNLNYAICDSYHIEEVYIDFKKNATAKHSKGRLWKEKLLMYQNNFDAWHNQYRYRVLIEGVFSTIKRKQINYIKAKTPLSQDIELLLKVVCHNIDVINRFFYGQ